MSSDSSDDENLELLKEAQDIQFLNENLYCEAKGGVKPNTEDRPASLRKAKDENEQFNILKVSPEFQKHVAKHLSLFLDKKLQNELEYAVNIKGEHKKRKSSGIKLFSNSKKSLKIEKHQLPVELSISKPVKRAILKRNISVKEEDLRNITVSGEDILSKKNTECWSNRFKSSKLFTYRKTKNGSLELLEP